MLTINLIIIYSILLVIENKYIRTVNIRKRIIIILRIGTLKIRPTTIILDILAILLALIESLSYRRSIELTISLPEQHTISSLSSYSNYINNIY